MTILITLTVLFSGAAVVLGFGIEKNKIPERKIKLYQTLFFVLMLIGFILSMLLIYLSIA